MTALSEDVGRELRAIGPVEVPLKANEVIFDGAITCFDANGLLVAGSNTAGLTYAGIYRGRRLDNSGGGEKAIVDPFAPYKAKIASADQTNLGDRVYLADDNTVSLSTSKSIAAGVILLVESATEVWVLPPAWTGQIAPPVAISDLTFTAVEIAAPAEATSTDGVAASVAQAVGELTFTAGAATGPEVEALQAQVGALATEAEKVGDDVRAVRALLVTLIAGLKTLTLAENPD